MTNSWSQLKDEVKSSISCVDYLHSRGYNVRRPNTCICAPSFIRSDSSPSFGVYDDSCFDFATQQSYDVIDLCALDQFAGDLTLALEHLAGKKLPSHVKDFRSSEYNKKLDKFKDRIHYWREELLKNPSVCPNGKNIPLIDYLQQRGISREAISRFSLGFSPKTYRLMIPFFNRSNQPVYAAGRSMGLPDPTGHCPKYLYLNLNVGEEFSGVLEKTIFGIDSLKPGYVDYDTAFDDELGQVIKLNTHHIRYDYLAVCEGMFDVLSFRTEGWAAISGKISQAQQKDFLDACRYYRDKGQKIFICFDNDNAGHNYQKKIAHLLFRYSIPFVAGHLPETIIVTRKNRPDLGQEIKVKDVSDYYAAGGSLDELVRSAHDGMAEIAAYCQDSGQLQQRFSEGAICCDRWDLRKLKQAAISIVDDDGQEDVTDDDGVVHTTTRKRRRFDPKEVNFFYTEAMKPQQDCDIAHVVKKKHNMIYDTLGQFYEYQKGVWKAINDILVEQHIMRAMNGHISAGKVTGVCRYLKTDLADNVQFNTKHNFVFQNGTLWLDEDNSPNLDVKSDFFNFPKNFRHSRPEDMSTLQVSYPFVPAARNDALIRAVEQWTANRDGTPNPEKFRLLQQMFGYILFVRNTLQKFFVLIGDGANGKSTCMHCIEAILGKENTTSLQISRLSSEFDPILLKNSRVNLSYDAQSAIENAQETLKALIGGDAITAAHKGVDAESFSTNAKFIVSANKFFSANDVSRGLLRRMLFIAFNNTFTPKTGDSSVEDEIMQDLPGLFNFAYEGYKDLKASGYFCETEEQRVLLEEFKEHLSPLMVFAREKLYTLSDADLDEHAIYFMYKEWCKENGEKPLSRIKCIADLRQVLRTDGNILPEPKRDPDTKTWLFHIPYNADIENRYNEESESEDFRAKTQTMPDNQEADTNDAVLSRKSNTQTQESASVHSGEVHGITQADSKTQTHQADIPRTSRQTLQVNAPASAAPAKKKPAPKKTDLHAPDYINTEKPIYGMSNAECWKIGWELIQKYAHFGRGWWKHARPQIKTGREYVCIWAMMIDHPETKALLPGFMEIFNNVITQHMADDELGTMDFPDTRPGYTWSPDGNNQNPNSRQEAK